MRFFNRTLAATLFLMFNLAWSDTYPPLRNDLKLPSITVLDDADHALFLPSALETEGKKPLLLLPVFTKCQMSCPIMVQGLRGALENYAKEGGLQNYRVIIFTFDASDTTADLQAFRLKQKIPASWKIIRSSDQGAIRSFFDQFSYAIMSSDGDFNHPNEIFVLNGNLIWVGSLFGSKLSASEIAGMFKTAHDSEKLGALPWIKSWVSQPENWVILGSVGFLGSLLFIFAVIFRRRKSAV